MMPTDADILALARRHLDRGLCFDRQAHITRSTDEELLAFGRAVAAEAEAEIARLRTFASEILYAWPDGGIEGDDLENIAVKHGLLAPETRTAPCRAEGCNCAEYYSKDEWDEGITCYRRAAWLKVKT